MPQPPADAVFRLWKFDVHVDPHPFCIGPKHMEGASGKIDFTRAGCYFEQGTRSSYGHSSGGRCGQPFDFHKPSLILFLVVPTKFANALNDVPGLSTYLAEHKAFFEEQKVAGFAFATEAQYALSNPSPNKPSWPPRTVISYQKGHEKFSGSVTAQLTQLGEQKPHFSITGNIRFANGGTSGGCCHEDILRAAPEWKPVVDLHLSDIDGIPSHGGANGHYWLVGGFWMGGKWYPNKYQSGDKYDQVMSREDLDRIAAEHFRISMEEVAQLRHDMEAAGRAAADRIASSEVVSEAAQLEQRAAREAATRAFIERWCEEQKPRWKMEADQAIKLFDLKVVKG